jgi:adenosylcobinamide kinase / adenosylcobinamide-phosphate guanylyltransferase
MAMPDRPEPSLRPGAAMQSSATLILGGARSGKSVLAERLALEACVGRAGPAVYVATAQPRDREMADRIAEHQARRGAAWRTIDAPIEIMEPLRANADSVVLLDCLTLWLANLLEASRNPERETSVLVATIAERRAPSFLVANEVGLGLVPQTPLGRIFRDEAGRLNQRVAAACDRVLFVAAGLPLQLKPAAGAA